MKVLDMKFHDLIMDRVIFVYDFMKFKLLKQRILSELLRKITLIIAKTIP